MQELIDDFAEQNHIDIIRVVDIAPLTLEENRGFSYAILLVKILPKEYIDKLNLSSACYTGKNMEIGNEQRGNR